MRPEAGKLPQCDGADGNVAEAGIVTGKVLIRGTAETAGSRFCCRRSQNIKTKRKDEGKEMERTASRRRKKEGIPSRIVKFLRREGRRCCAAALCVSMVMGNVVQAAVAVEEDTDGTIIYDLDSISLYGALQKAVLDGNPVEKELLFEGEEAESYAQLLGETKDLYELKPEIEGQENGIELRVFARLNQDIELDRGYEISGDESLVFLLTNKSRQTKTAVIQVDQKRSEEIPVPPRSTLGIDAENPAYLSAADMGAGPDADAVPGEAGAASGTMGGSGTGTGGGGGSGSGGSGAGSGDEDKISASDTLEGMVEPDQTEDEKENIKEDQTDTEDTPVISIETEKNPGGQENPDSVPDVNIADQENSSQGKEDHHPGADKEDSDSVESEGTAGEDGKESGSDQGDTGNQDGSGSQDTSGNGGNGENSSNGSNSGQSGDNGNGSNSSNNNQDNNASGNNDSHDSTANSGNTENSSNNGSGEAGSGGSSNDADGNGGSSPLAISRHRVGLVASAKVLEKAAETATPSEATPSNRADKEEASPSNAEANLLEGTLYNPVILDGNAVVAFAVTASELGLDDERFQMMMIYEPEVPLEGVKVRVGVSPDAFSEEVTLHVKELKPEGETSDQYQLAEESLAREGISYEGMAALDISFLDTEGNEVEPAEEALVSIQMDRGRLPEGISPDAISVQHHKKDGDSGAIMIEQVVDPAKAVEAELRLEEAEIVSREKLEEVSGGVLEMNDEALVTEFSVESFSTFTITWSSWGVGGITRSVQVHYVDEGGREITCDKAPTQVNRDFVWNKEATLRDYAFSIDGYVYQGAHLEAVGGESVTQLRVESHYVGWGDREWVFEYSSDGSTWKSLPNNSDIYLVYKGSAPTPPTPGSSQAMSHDKRAVRKDDGTYDLILTVSGAFGSESSPALLDVIYVVDESGSMTSSRFTSTKNAITGLTNALTTNTKIDPRFSVVTFSGDNWRDEKWNDAQIKVNWTKNKNEITNVSFNKDGGTNYQAGIRTAKELLSDKRKNATTAVVFLSDGNPTFRYGNDGYTEGTGSSDRDGLNLKAAMTEASEASGFYADYFFAVGVGDPTDYGKLEELGNAANAATKKFFSTSETDKNSLINAFNEIQDSITTYLCSDVTVTDTLSAEVKIVTNAEGAREDLEILVTKEDDKGNAVTVASGKSPLTVEEIQINARYEEDNGKTKIVMDFPNDYELKKGYIYQVKAHIEATEAAYEKYRSDGWNLVYQDKPEEGTGTHADKQEQGVYSNTEAAVTYKYRGEDKTEEYFKPVIQLNPGELIIEKTVTGLDGDHLNRLMGTAENSTGLSFKTTFSWNGKTDEITLPLKNLTGGKTKTGIHYEITQDNDGKYTIHFKGLSPDTRYTVTEEHADVEGYSLKTTKTEAEGTVEKGQTKTASFTNAYTKKLTLKVWKKVTGNMGDRNQGFEFNYTLKDASGNVIDGYTVLDKNGNKITADPVSLKNDEYFVINDIPEGARIVITETNGSDYITEITKTGKNDWKPGENSNWKPDITPEKSTIAGKSFELTMTDTEEVTFTNTKNISSPTGLHSNRLPHLLLLAMAALGMAGMAATGAAAKVRRKDDEQ